MAKRLYCNENFGPPSKIGPPGPILAAKIGPGDHFFAKIGPGGPLLGGTDFGVTVQPATTL